MSARPSYLLPIFALLAGLANTADAVELDYKGISLFTCQPYHPGQALDPTLLQFRHDGISNRDKSYRYVACPLPKDSDKSWTHANQGLEQIHVLFSKEKNEAPPPTNNMCALMVGSPFYGPPTIKALYASYMNGVEAQLEFDYANAPEALPLDSVTLICMIAPNNKLEFIHFIEKY